MIQFASPIWLWAISGIAVPLVIHLWNVKQGKTLKVGSVLFLTETARSRATSFKIAEWLLLLVRCLLIIAAALLIAGPYLLQENTSTKDKGWVLIEKENAGIAYHHYQLQIDSLLHQGYTLHYFSKGFPAIDPGELQKRDTLAKATHLAYWPLLQELNQQLAASLPVYLYTDHRLENFNGTRPVVAMNIKWITYSLPETTEKNSKAVGDHAKNIFIYSDKSTSADATYLDAALHAIADFTGKSIHIKSGTDSKSISGQYDWLFWLSENEIPANLLQQQLFAYTKGKSIDTHSEMITDDRMPTGLTEPLQLYKWIEAPDHENAELVWKDGYGRPLLNKNKKTYYFNSHFDPQWNDIVWSGQFPQILFHLLYSDAIEKANLPGNRIIDEQQVQPFVADANSLLPKTDRVARTEYDQLLWIIVFVLFVLERTMVYQKRRRAKYA